MSNSTIELSENENTSTIYISPNGTGTGSSLNDTANWTTAYENSTNNGTIIFTNGTYNIVNQTINKDLILSAYTPGSVTLDANNAGYIFFTNNSNVVIDGLILTHGTGYSYILDGQALLIGGAVCVENGNLYNFDSIYINNTAEYGGAIRLATGKLYNFYTKFINNTGTANGGVINLWKDGIIFNTNCSYVGNKALQYGGAIDINTTGNVVNINTEFINNTALEGAGISIGYLDINYSNYVGNGNITNINSTFTNNKAKYGGALFLGTGNIFNDNCEYTDNYCQDNGGAIILLEGNINSYNSVFKNNTACGYGGAIRSHNATINCSDCLFMNNKANYSGGALYIQIDGKIICEDSVFTNNSANSSGGAIQVNRNSSLNCVDCYFSKNNALNMYGGAIRGGINSTINVSKCEFTNNFANQRGGAINGNNLSVTYSAFINNTCNNTNNTIDVNKIFTIDYNWWGNNTPDNSQVLEGNASIKPNNTVYLTVNPTGISDGLTNKNYTIIVNMNQYLNSAGELINLNESLAPIFVTLNTTNGTIDNPINLIDENNTFTSTYTSPNTKGNYTITVTVNNETLIIPVEIKNDEGISGNNLTKVYQTDANYTGLLIGSNGKPISDVNIILRFINLKTGASKNYTVTSNTNGEYSIPIGLAPGYYKVFASYENYTCRNNINVYANETNTNSTTLTTKRLIETYGDKQNLTGTLLNTETGKAVIGQHICIQLTRVSDGASKIYWSTTDINGEYQLEINFAPGEYRAYCTFDGTSQYTPSGSGTLITVN